MTSPTSEDPAQFAALARYDWVVTKTWRRLHALPYGPWTLEQFDDIAFGWTLNGPVRLACGRIGSMACIPGFGSRLGLARCSGCCRAYGYPQGSGSPKNDPAIRAILGLDDSAFVGKSKALERKALECSSGPGGADDSPGPVSDTD